MYERINDSVNKFARQSFIGLIVAIAPDMLVYKTCVNYSVYEHHRAGTVLEKPQVLRKVTFYVLYNVCLIYYGQI